MKRRAKLIVVFLIILLFILVSLSFYFTSTLKSLKIKGNTYYTEEEIRRLIIESRLDENALFLYMKLKYGKGIEAPFISEIDVDLIGIDSLNVRVFEKDIMGAFPYMGEYVCFDKDGIMVGSIVNNREDVPIIEGITYNKVVFSEVMDTGNPELFDVILNLTQLIKKYKITVQKIEFDKNLGVWLFCDSIKVKLGKRKHFDEQISNLSEILLKTKGMKGVLRMEDYSLTNRRVIFEENGK